MKKKLTLIFVLSTFIFAFSQFRFGAKFGVQKTAIVDIHNPSDPRNSFHLGVLAQYNLNDDDQFYIQGELNYLNAGEKSNPNKVYLNYLALPIMFKAYFSEAESEFFAEIGPQFVYEVSNNTTIPEADRWLEHGDQIKTNKFNFSLGLGIGYSYKRKIEGGIRYNYGLSDIYPDYKADKINRDSVAALYVAYVFD